MHQNIHHSFSNISADQSFNIDDVIVELARVRGNYKNGLENKLESASKALKENRALSTFAFDTSRMSNEFLKYHNALIVAENLKQGGATAIVMNPKKDICDQIIAMATKENCPNLNLSDKTGVGAQAAQQRLCGAGSLGEP